jgi:hypothetical protein
MTWITQCSAPDLTGLFVPVLANYFLNVMFVGAGGSNDPTVRSYAHMFIVTTDKALRHYNAGRQLLVDYVASSNRTMLLVEGVGHFETCVSTVKRSVALADRMAAHPENPDIDRTSRRLLDSCHAQVRPLRDAIEHMDQDVAKGGAQSGSPQMLFVSPDGSRLVIGSHALTFAQLSMTLTELHSLSTALAGRDRGP